MSANQPEAEKVAIDLEARAKRLAGQTQPKDIGNDEVVFAIAQLVRVMGKADKSANKYSRRLFWLTILTAILILLQIFLSIQPSKSPCTYFKQTNHQFIQSNILDLNGIPTTTSTIQSCATTFNLGFFGAHTWVTNTNLTPSSISFLNLNGVSTSTPWLNIFSAGYQRAH